MRKIVFHKLWLFVLFFGFLTQAMAQTTVRLEEEVRAFVSEEYVMPKEDLWLEIEVTYQDRPTPSKVAYMELVSRDGISVKQDMVKLVSGRASAYLTIPDNLPSDYYLLRIYTRNSPNLSVERGVVHKIIGVINPNVPPPPLAKPVDTRHYLPAGEASNAPFQIETNKKSYRTQEEVKLRLTGEKGTRVTVTAAIDPGLPKIPEVNASAIYDAQKSRTYISEIFGHVIHGKTLLQQVDTTETFFLSIHGDNDSQLAITKPLPTGDLFFETGAFDHYNFIIVQSETIRDRIDFIPESPYWNTMPVSSFQLPELKLPENLHTWLQNRLTARLATVYYHPPVHEQSARLPDFFVTDNSYLLDDYNRFDDMATVIREYVPQVLVRRSNKKIVFRNVNSPASRNFRNNPLLLIDAMPVLDSDAFAKFNPKDIRKMDIVTRPFYMDHKEFEGAVVLTSFENDFGKFELSKNALLIAYTGMQKPKVISAPDKPGRFTPDFKSLLFWETFLLSENSHEVTFQTSSLEGEYRIRCLGYSENGTLTKTEVEIKVQGQ